MKTTSLTMMETEQEEEEEKEMKTKTSTKNEDGRKGHLNNNSRIILSVNYAKMAYFTTMSIRKGLEAFESQEIQLENNKTNC